MASDLETRFTAGLFRQYASKQTVKKVLSFQRSNMNFLLGNIIEAQNSEKKTQNQYYLLQKYEILMCGHVRKIIRKQSVHVNIKHVFLCMIT